MRNKKPIDANNPDSLKAVDIEVIPEYIRRGVRLKKRLQSRLFGSQPLKQQHPAGFKESIDSVDVVHKFLWCGNFILQ